MMEHSFYSVISPEGCAQILWKDPSKASEAAASMKLTAQDLKKMEVIDHIIDEPIGGAHRNREEVIFSVKEVLRNYLKEFETQTGEEILKQRKEKFLSIGKQKSFKIFSSHPRWPKGDNFFVNAKKMLFKFKKELIIIILLVFVTFLFLF